MANQRILGSLAAFVLGGAVGLGGVRAEGQDVTLSSGPYRGFKQWTRVNEEPVFSATHGESFVVTYVNPAGRPSAIEGQFPFPAGTVIAKQSFQNHGCSPGARGAVTVMEKRAEGYDPAAGDWHWVRYNADGTLWGEGSSVGRMGFCAACHAAAKVNDYVFGNGTSIKATPTMPLSRCR